MEEKRFNILVVIKKVKTVTTWTNKTPINLTYRISTQIHFLFHKYVWLMLHAMSVERG